MSQAFCLHCGLPNRLTAKYCFSCGTPLNSHSSSNLTGRLPPNYMLNQQYIITQKLGQGGMGAVYKVTDTKQNRILAVKEMSDALLKTPQEKKEALEQFETEASLLQKLNHPNLPFVTDRFAVNDRHYLVMEFIPGQTLEDMFASYPQGFTEDQVLAWTHQLCAVLQYLHSQRPPIVFRDLKPSNIMVRPDGQVKLIDFGIVRFFKKHQSRDTVALGTPGFVPPEQYTGQTTPLSDIYGLGATMFSLLGGDPTIYKPYEPLPPIRQINPNVSAETESVIAGAVQMKENYRWSSIAVMRQELPQPRNQTAVSAKQVTNANNNSNGQRTRTARPTTRLLLKAAQLTPKQLWRMGSSLLIIILISTWMLTPYVAGTWFWFNVPLVAFVATFAYAATRKHGIPFIAQLLVSILGGWIVYSHVNYSPETNNLLWGAFASGMVIEGMLIMLPIILGNLNRDDPGAWQREACWLGGTAVVGNSILNYIAIGPNAMAFKLTSWVFAFVLGILSWFIGDLIQGMLYLKQTGTKWRKR